MRWQLEADSFVSGSIHSPFAMNGEIRVTRVAALSFPSAMDLDGAKFSIVAKILPRSIYYAPLVLRLKPDEICHIGESRLSGMNET